jgi:glycosyltransferase involved in cell wall biosynthesis
MHLILFFTYGVSLKTWDKFGLIDREILLYKNLVEKGMQITFITYGDCSDYHYQGKLSEVEIVPFYAYTKKPKLKVFALLHSLFLPFILREKIKQADILKTNQMWGSWVALFSKLLYRKKMIVRCGYEHYRFTLLKGSRLFYKIVVFLNSLLNYKFSDVIIATSNKDKNFIIRTFNIKKNKINVFMNFIDIDAFRNFNEEKKNKKLLFVGRLTKQKNIFTLLDAVSQTSCELDIIGDGELCSEIANYIKEKRIKAKLLGPLPNSELPKFYNRYPVYILPSFYEGNPKTLLEAMLCGSAVIATNVEGIREIIEHRVNGLLCEPTIDSIREAIQELMSDPQLRSRLGIAARGYIENHCNLNSIVDSEYRIYEKLLDKLSKRN